jgi:hypothetical protein
MGRSFLSVKLAFGFGVLVAVLVLVHERVTAGPLLVEAVRTAENPVALPMVVDAGGVQFEADSTDGRAATSVCLWRGCPAALVHPLLHAATPPRVVGAQRRTRAHPTI